MFLAPFNVMNNFGTASQLRYSEGAVMSTEVQRRLFTVHDYHRMVEAGILREGDRVELIYGEILAMSPIGPPHGSGVDRATRLLVRAVGDDAIVRVQGSVRLNEYNEPQPDIVLLRPEEDFYYAKLPGPDAILLIVEFAESSLTYDRGLKAQLYAETGIPEYWVADLKHDRLFVYSDPYEKAYRVVRELSRSDSIAVQLLPQCRLNVRDLLP
jgi:Uma2 family endonuclease